MSQAQHPVTDRPIVRRPQQATTKHPSSAAERIFGRSVVYVTCGDGECASEALTEGDLVETRDFKFKAKTDSKLILAFEI